MTAKSMCNFFATCCNWWYFSDRKSVVTFVGWFVTLVIGYWINKRTKMCKATITSGSVNNYLFVKTVKFRVGSF